MQGRLRRAPHHLRPVSRANKGKVHPDRGHTGDENRLLFHANKKSRFSLLVAGLTTVRVVLLGREQFDCSVSFFLYFGSKNSFEGRIHLVSFYCFITAMVQSCFGNSIHSPHLPRKFV